MDYRGKKKMNKNTLFQTWVVVIWKGENRKEKETRKRGAQNLGIWVTTSYLAHFWKATVLEFVATYVGTCTELRLPSMRVNLKCQSDKI